MDKIKTRGNKHEVKFLYILMKKIIIMKIAATYDRQFTVIIQVVVKNIH